MGEERLLIHLHSGAAAEETILEDVSFVSLGCLPAALLKVALVMPACVCSRYFHCGLLNLFILGLNLRGCNTIIHT